MRTPAQYEFTYNQMADKYLANTDIYVDNVQNGNYLQNGGVITLLFSYAQYSINTNITQSKTSEHVLDKIIILI